MALFNGKKYQDCPNPNARIGFVIFYPFQFYVYKNVYKYLASESEFIVDAGPFFPAEQPESLLKDIVSFLKEKGVYFRILNYDDYFFETYLKKFFSRYGLLVSLWHRGCLNLPCNLNRKKVSMNYGVGKALTTFRLNQTNWDAHLSFGPYDHEIIKLMTYSEIVGNPKFDDWFNGEFDDKFLADLKNKLNPNKKSILYLPTHSDLCSIDDLANQLKKITKNYNVITKFHYFTSREEAGRVKKLRHKNIILFNDDTDLLPLLKAADVVLSDNSSAIFDAILADKPLVVTDFLSKRYLDEEHRKIRQYRRGVAGASTYSGSIEQRIKKEGLILSIKKPGQLDETIKRALEDTPFFKENRKKIREEVFSFNDGKCGERAAGAIKNLLSAKELPERPVLYWVVEDFERNLYLRPPSDRKKDAKKIQDYEALLQKKIQKQSENKLIFSVIAINFPEDEEGKFLRICLRSLLSQKFPSDKFEIIVANVASEKEVGKIIENIPLITKRKPIVKCITKKNNDQGLMFLKEAINRAKGEIICFTKSNCLLPTDWLLNFFQVYQSQPGISGVGGYEMRHLVVQTIFDEYYYSELGRKLGINKEYFYLMKTYGFKNSLFYQNPAGAISNVSYKKDILKDLPLHYEASLIEIFEADLKLRFLLDNELWFTPNPVYNMEKMTFGKFIEKNFYEGITCSFLVSAAPELKKYYNYTILSLIKFPLLNFLDGYLKIRLSFLIFIGSFFRLLGQWSRPSVSEAEDSRNNKLI